MSFGMWKKRLVWKNDSIEFNFQDQVVSLEESIQDDEMLFRASMKSGNQIKEVEFRMNVKTVSEENNRHVSDDRDLTAISGTKSGAGEKNDAHLHMSVKVVFEDAFFGHQGNDLFYPEAAPITEFRIKKSATLNEFLSTVAEDMRLPVQWRGCDDSSD